MLKDRQVAEPERPEGDPGDEQHEAHHEQDGALDPAAPGGLAPPATADRGRELGVLLVEGAFDLFEQALLVLGERHAFTSGTRNRTVGRIRTGLPRPDRYDGRPNLGV